MKIKKLHIMLIALIAIFSVSAIVMFGIENKASKTPSTEAVPLENKEGETMHATIETSMGTIKVKLDSAKAPLTVKNFADYATAGFYDGTIFHRVIPGFMVQGGGFTADGTQKETNPPIKNEAKNGLLNRRGTIAMARTNVIDSATSQFFINLADNGFLNYQNDNNYGYAVFGEVVEGMDVVDKIAGVATGSNGPYQDWPLDDVVIEKVTVE